MLQYCFAVSVYCVTLRRKYKVDPDITPFALCKSPPARTETDFEDDCTNVKLNKK